MKRLCVIPARGGSKRVERKNIRNIGGRPALEYTIESARSCQYPLEIVVLTDDGEIADVARRCGARVVDEPLEMAHDDYSNETDLILFATDQLDPDNSLCECVVVQYACVPIKPPRIIDRLIESIERTGADMVQTAAPIDRTMHPYRMFQVDGEGRPYDLVPGTATLMSQDYPAFYVRTGAGYVIRRATLSRIRGRSFYEPELSLDRRMIFHELNECVDIDTYDDLRVAERMLSAEKAGGPAHAAE